MSETDSVQPDDLKAPISFAVQITLIVIAFVGAMILAIGGSYALTVQAINNEKHYEAQIRVHAAKLAAALHQREEESAIRTGIPTCKAIVRMDDASHGASNASSDPNSYGHRLAKAIHVVNETSGCAVLIHEVDAGWSIKRMTAAAEQRAKKAAQQPPKR